MAYDASDTRAIRRAAKAAKQAEAERRIVVFNLMSTPAGRAYIHDRLVRCHCFVPSFSTSALSMAFAEGERNIGLQDLNDVMAFAPDQYIQMMREAGDRDAARRSNDDRPIRDRQDGGRDDNGSGTVESDYDPTDADDTADVG